MSESALAQSATEPRPDEEQTTPVDGLIYGLEDRPPTRRFIVYSFQHLMTGFATMIGVPLAFAGAAKLGAGDERALISGVLVSGGVLTLIQTLSLGPIGARLPLVNSTTFKFLGPLLVAYKAGGLGAIYMMSIVSGFITAALGVVVGIIQKVFTPFIVGSFLIITGVSLMPIAATNLLTIGKPHEGSWEALTAAGLTLLVMLYLSMSKARGVRGLRSLSILIGFVVGYVYSLGVGLTNFDGVGSASWFGLASPYSGGSPTWPGISLVITFTFVFISCLIETAGDATAVAAIVGRKISPKQLRGAVMADGLSGPISSILGGLPMTTYGQNVGLVRLSGVGSRFVVAGTGLMLVIVGAIPKFSALVAAMPVSVLGAGLAMTFGIIAVEGIRRAGPYVAVPRNAVVLIVGLVPALSLRSIPTEFLSRIPETIAPLLTDPLVAGLLFVIIAHLILPGRTDTTPAPREDAHGEPVAQPLAVPGLSVSAPAGSSM